ncbi:hypothetical protein CR199_15000 [Enterococcus faecium]|uniref:hypothetical protein n=1 Tax=Enterococcus faecium TaxID=1352 RepID=UPI000C0207E5|nr:hypothetical protein CR199_15000 [Enterococcus faecium]
MTGPWQWGCGSPIVREIVLTIASRAINKGTKQISDTGHHRSRICEPIHVNLLSFIKFDFEPCPLLCPQMILLVGFKGQFGYRKLLYVKVVF